VVIDSGRGTVYVGGDVGVFSLERGAEEWAAVGRSLPLVPVLDLRLHAPSATLFAGTFGRSVWRIGL